MNNKAPLGFRFSVLNRAAKKYIDEQLKAEGLTGVQLFVLGQLERLMDMGQAEINQKDLEKASCVKHPTMTDILKRLERKGYISCARSETDRRNKCIVPTDKGQNVENILRRADGEVFALLCEGLSREQIMQFMAISEVMVANAEKILEKGCDCDGDYKDSCRLSERV